MKEFNRHFEKSVVINAETREVFAYADNHKNFSAHMNQSSWMMGGGSMKTQIDKDNGQKIGSHIKMDGSIFGINLYLDEIVTEYDPPYKKVWETVGKINLLVIDHYRLGFVISPENEYSKLRVYIDYNLPVSKKAKWFGYLMGEMYVKWCVNQMINSVVKHFNKI